MSGRFGRLALDEYGRNFGSKRRTLNDDEKMRHGTCTIHRKGEKYHVYDGDRKIKAFDSLRQAQDCIDERARKGSVK